MGINIGLDIGVASVGVAVVDQEYNILEVVSDIFPEANAASNAERRSFRQGRRLKRRQRNRILDFNKLWIASGFPIPKHPVNEVVYLRIKGLKEKISLDEIYWVLLNNLKHRGISYLDDAIDETATGNYAKGIAINQRELNEKLPCEIQAERLEKYGTYRGETVIKENGEEIALSNIFTVSAYEKEINIFLNTQRKYHSDINDSFVEQFIEIFNRKRKYYEGPGNELSRTDYGRFTTKKDENGNFITEENIFEKLIGRCSVYPEEMRAAAASYTAQEFNLLNDLNNLTVNGRKLEQNEKERIVDMIKNAASVRMEKIIAEVVNDRNPVIEGARIDKDGKKIFHSFETYRKLKTAFEKAELKDCFNELSVEELDIMAEILTLNTEKESIISSLKNKGLSKCERYADFLAEFRKKNSSNFSKWHSFSLKIMRELIPEMYEQSKEQMTLLTDMGVIKSSDEKYLNRKYIPVGDVIENIYNPVVRRSVKVACTVVNALIKKYGKIDNIVIEMPRDRNSDEKKKRIADAQKKNEKEIQNIIERVKTEYNVSIGVENYKRQNQLNLKLKLWNEQQGRCLYSGKTIEITDLLNNPDKFEIDHALPLSISFDDSRSNKVLVFRTENQNKGNRTPYGYLSNLSREWGYPEYEAYVNSLNIPWNKKNKLLFQKDITKIDVLRGFIARNVTDTSYASRTVLNVLQSFFKANNLDTKIKVIRGSFTHQMRDNLHLKKDRDESYAHHAIDAVLIAFSQMGYDAYHKLQGSVIDFETGEILDQAEFNKVVSEQNFKKVMYENRWLQNVNAIKAAENKVKYWYMVDKKCNRGLANQTIYGSRNIDGKTLKVSKTHNIYSDAGIKELRKRLEKGEYDCFLMYRNDRQSWDDMMKIIERYSDAKNPFVQYEKETGDFFRKYSKKHNGPRIEQLKYLDGEVGSCIDISHKYGHERNSKKVFLEQLVPFRMDVYFNKNTKLFYFVGLKQSDVIVQNGKHVISEEAYANALIQEKLIKPGQSRADLDELGYEFRLSFYKDEFINYEKSGKYYIERFLSRTMPNDRNYIEVKPIFASKYPQRALIGLSKTSFVRKIRVDILGNRYECAKEKFTIEC